MSRCVKILILTLLFCWVFISSVNAQISFENVSTAAGITGSYFTHSVIWADYDNDGDIDLFVVHYTGTQLYTNNGNGSFSLTSNQASLSPDIYAYSAVMGDFDNDHDLDIAIGGDGGSDNLKLFRNDNGVFVDITLSAGIGHINYRVIALTWLDLNHDGFLDLYGSTINNPKQIMYLNDGDGTFTESSEQTGLNFTANSRGTAVGDYDNDNDLDLFIACSETPNKFLQNNNGVFMDIASALGISYPTIFNGNAVFGDYDNDGDVDLLLSYSGSPVKLLRNNGNSFTDVTSASGLQLDCGVNTGSAFADFDNDGDLDIVAQIHCTGKRIGLFSNNGNGTFADISSTFILHNTTVGTSNSLAVGDYDDDGKLDLYIGETQTSDSLYHNNTTNTNHYIKFKLNGVISNTTAIGASVKLRSNNHHQYRYVTGNNGFSQQNDMILHFGLGTATLIDTLIVQWPSGIKQVHTNLNLYDTTLVLNEIDLSDPKPVTEIGQYSDYTTPNSMTLTWIDPVEFYNGNPIDTFVIDIYKNDTLINSVNKGIQTYTDSGLTDGTYYIYSFVTRHIPSDSTSNLVESEGWYVGGHPEPSAPTNLIAIGFVNHAKLIWHNPSTQIDGTPLDDLSKIYIYRNNVLIDSVDQSGGVDTTYDDYLPSLETAYAYKVRAVDNESQVHMSDFSNESIAPPVLSVSDTVLTNTLNAGSLDSSSFWIYNNGLSDLEFFIRESKNVFSFLNMERLSDEQTSTEPIELPDRSTDIISCGRAPIVQNMNTNPTKTISKITSAADYNAFGSDAWGNNFLAFDLTSPQSAINKGSQYGLFIDGAAFSKDGSVLYAIDRYNSPRFGKIDTSNGIFTQISILPSGSWTDMTVDPTDGTIYATFVDGSNNSFLYSISTTGSTTLKGQMNGVNVAIGLAADKSGQLYVYDIGGDNFFSVNKSNGSSTLIGPIGFNASYAQSMEFDPNDNTCYMAAFNYNTSEAELRRVNVSTGSTTLIGPIGSGYGVEICGLGIAGTGLSWIDVNPVSGTIETGDSAEIKLYWNGQNTEKIIIPYDGYLGVMTNDPLLPVSNIRLHLEVTVGIAEENIKPVSYALHSNYPNPFNPATTIRYDLKESGKVSLRIYNTLGQEVRTLVNRYETAGYKSIPWDGKDNAGRMVSSGLYIYRIETGSFVKSRKMMLLK